MYDILKKNSKHVILAGDDDQAIYGWAGADVARFQSEPAKDIILPQSYRVPGAVQNIANNILNRIPDHRRIKKYWKPREDVLLPIVQYVSSIEDVPLNLGDWLILARTNDKLTKLKPILKDMGIYFEIKGRKSYRTRLYKSIQDYTRWTNGDKLSLSEIKDLFEFLGVDKTLTDERMYDLGEFGFTFTDHWYEVFQADPEECLYIREMMRNEEKLKEDPRVKLQTIHAAKGGEANNVLIILDNTKKIREAIEKNQDKYDEEQRVWYVGVTRTKQNLYIMTAKREDWGYDI
jgi:DNA helicase-2/ATP-dependent DNA helicase PcrA